MEFLGADLCLPKGNAVEDFEMGGIVHGAADLTQMAFGQSAVVQ